MHKRRRFINIRGIDKAVRIAIITNDIGGGTGNHLLAMLKHWDKNVWNTVILSTAPGWDRTPPDVPIQYLPPSKYLRHYPVAQFRYISQLGRVLNSMLPDIVHTYFFWAILYGRLLKMAGKIPILVENREDEGFNWGFHEYLLLRMTRKVPDKIICVSEAVKKVVQKRERIEDARISVINNGVDSSPVPSRMEAATRRELGLTEENLVIGMVANYNRPVKGVGNFLEVIPAIVSTVPSARFLFVGGGSEENALREKARSLGIEPYLVFVGYTKEIHRYYEIMDISVLNSFSEGLSLTLLESMMYGIPVVATRVGGNPELVAEGESGYLVPVNNHGLLTDRIVELLSNPDLRRRLGEAGRLRIERNFQMRDVAIRYLEIYEGLLSERAPQKHSRKEDISRKGEPIRL
jgi:glycosyltransferase involved in cell wall biosynthesis